MKKQLSFIFCFLFLFSFHLSAKVVDWDPQVIVDGKSYVSEHPFVLKGNDVFVSLHALRDVFGFSQSYKPKLDSDVLSKPGKNILVVRHSREIWLNKSKHFLSKSSFFYKSRLYVPVNDIAMFLGYRIEKEASVLTFKKEASQRFMSASRWSTFLKRHVDESYLSAKRARDSRSLLYKAHKMSVKKRFFVQNDIVYIDATRLLKKLGYRLKHIKQGVSLTYNEFSYTIPFNSREWKGVFKKEKWTFVSEAPLLQKNGVLWMPFNSLLTFLDYSIHYNAVTRDIELLDNIHGVEFVKRKGSHAVKVVSRHTLTAYSLFHDKAAHIQ
ncbi:copper amine oxidase N-terminal domain-containing protein, partial [bacterium]|nr:copper amine oxidase N-terminal domain-containing protein [bacterium]